ncbi:HupE/UreJ family protein [Ideonella sp. YS5]|uniref:HupE/UreJ family protein n=1 Tax=Ideonella sp. YS5 TaxID=3453714 RepID=UPI003EECD1CC
MNSSVRTVRLLLASIGAASCLLLAPEVAQAHAPSNATLDLAARGNVVEQRWDIALRDLDRVLPLDANDDGSITWGEVRLAWPQIAALADAGLRLTVGERDLLPCTPGALDAPRIDSHADGSYAVLARHWHCPADVSVRGLKVDYRLFGDSDASHRGLLQWRAVAEGGVTTAVLAPAAGPLPLAGGGEAGGAAPASTFGSFVAEGIRHILIGTDHVLFLLALMLPAVLVTRTGEAGGWRATLWRVAQVVTAFTVAHSITLALSVLGYADPPSRVVESLIAASVVLAAVDNLKRFLPGVRWRAGAPGARVPTPPAERVIGQFAAAVRWRPGAPGAGVPAPPAKRVIGRFAAAAVRWQPGAPGIGVPAPPAKRVIGRFAAAVRWQPEAPGAGVPAPPAERAIGRFGAAVRWPMAFVFGLVHGFGFAGALKELGLEPVELARSLVGFNVGVELGQLGIVAIALPLAWWVRETRFYRQVVLVGGSVAIAAIAAVWFAERAFDLQVLT